MPVSVDACRWGSRCTRKISEMMWHFGGCPAAGRHDNVHTFPFMFCLFLLSVDKEKCALFHSFYFSFLCMRYAHAVMTTMLKVVGPKYRDHWIHSVSRHAPWARSRVSLSVFERLRRCWHPMLTDIKAVMMMHPTSNDTGVGRCFRFIVTITMRRTTMLSVT